VPPVGRRAVGRARGGAKSVTARRPSDD